MTLPRISFVAALILAFGVSGSMTACSIQSRTVSEPLPTGEETARSASERTRQAQESEKTGLIYATSDPSDDADPDEPTSDDDAPDTAPTQPRTSKPSTLQWNPELSADRTTELDLDSIRASWTEARDSSIVALEMEIPNHFEPETVTSLVDLAYTLGFERIVIVRVVSPDSQSAGEEPLDASEPDPNTP